MERRTLAEAHGRAGFRARRKAQKQRRARIEWLTSRDEQRQTRDEFEAFRDAALQRLDPAASAIFLAVVAHLAARPASSSPPVDRSGGVPSLLALSSDSIAQNLAEWTAEQGFAAFLADASLEVKTQLLRSLSTHTPSGVPRCVAPLLVSSGISTCILANATRLRDADLKAFARVCVRAPVEVESDAVGGAAAGAAAVDSEDDESCDWEALADDDGPATAVAHLTSPFSALTSLDLSRCALLTHHVVRYLAEPGHLSQLQTLRVDGCSFKSGGAFLHVVAHRATALQTLSLVDCEWLNDAMLSEDFCRSSAPRFVVCGDEEEEEEVVVVGVVDEGRGCVLAPLFPSLLLLDIRGTSCTKSAARMFHDSVLMMEAKVLL